MRSARNPYLQRLLLKLTRRNMERPPNVKNERIIKQKRSTPERKRKRVSMKNTDFYAFCRDSRKTEPDPHKRGVLTAVYRYMWECGVTIGGVNQYIALRASQANSDLERLAYEWL